MFSFEKFSWNMQIVRCVQQLPYSYLSRVRSKHDAIVLARWNAAIMQTTHTVPLQPPTEPYDIIIKFKFL